MHPVQFFTIANVVQFRAYSLGTVFLDRDRDVWMLSTHGIDGFSPILSCPETADMRAERVLEKFGPLTLAWVPDEIADPAEGSREDSETIPLPADREWDGTARILLIEGNGSVVSVDSPDPEVFVGRDRYGTPRTLTVRVRIKAAHLDSSSLGRR